MNRLIRSSKFWTAVVGSLFIITGYLLTKDHTVTALVGSLFGAGQIGTAVEDAITKRNGA